MAERVFRLVGNVDVRKFKLDPTDGFLLTRIDGRSGSKVLASETGLPEQSVDQSLEKLAKLGIIEPLGSPSTTAPKPVSSVMPGPAAERKSGIPQFVSISAPKYDLKELEEVCDLT